MLCNIHGSSDVFHEMHLASASIISVHNAVMIFQIFFEPKVKIFYIVSTTLQPVQIDYLL